jgi:hypothetical protein
MKGGRNMKDNKSVLWVVMILAVLLVGALVYIGVDKYSAWKQNKENNLFQQGVQSGYQQGYQQAVLQIANGAVTCQQVPLVVGDKTINLIAVDCLKVAGQ